MYRLLVFQKHQLVDAANEKAITEWAQLGLTSGQDLLSCCFGKGDEVDQDYELD
jgi:hypothetical protein